MNIQRPDMQTQSKSSLHIAFAGCLAALSLFSACDSPLTLMNEDSFAQIEPGKLVCDPFASSNTQSARARAGKGWVGQMRYLPAGATPLNTARAYRDSGQAQAIDATLFLSQLDVPTRRFDLGFMTEAGDLVQTPQGNTLYEYFSLHLDTEIEIPVTQAAGAYQFALLADDGAVLTADLDGSGNFQTLVDNDGTHPTKLMVSTRPVQLSHGQRLPLHIDYYQGPRYHIALQLLWRPWTGNGQEPWAGRSGNSLFFDSNTVPSTELAAYQDLKANGWVVIPADRFFLPERYASNPCAAVQPPQTLVSQFCSAERFVAKGSAQLGLVTDPAEGSQAHILSALGNLGYSTRAYAPQDFIGGAPTVDSVNVLFIARVASVQPVPAGFDQAIRQFIANGGSVIAEYDGAASFFSQAGQGDPTVLEMITPFWNFFTGQVDGGGLLIPRNTSTLYVTDTTDAIMQGVPTSYLQGTKAAFGISHFDNAWLHVSAEFSSESAIDWGPLARYPAVLSGRCNQGRVTLFTMSLLSSAADAPVQQMLSNAIRWSVGQ